nr:unnamed protein product [Digitaria exilis]
MPGHILLPAPNGMNSKSAPLKSMSPRLSNLSGLNSSASSQYLASLDIAHAFTKTAVPLGMSNGPGGCSLKVSLITRCM